MTFVDSLIRSRIPHRRTGHEVSLNCPFCPKNRGVVDFKYGCHVNTNSGAGKCWHTQCGWKSWRAITEVLLELRMSTEVDGVDAPVIHEPVKLPRDFLPLTKAYDDLDRAALRYVRKRGISPRQIRERGFGVSYIDKYAYRIVMPVYVKRELKAIVARDFTGRQEPKYLNSKGEKYLFGFDPEEKTVVLAEGIFKALRIELSGRPAAALLGHDITPIQIEQLKDSRCEKVVFWPDVDLVGRRGVHEAAIKLLDTTWKGTVEVAWPVTKPADEMTLEELRDTPSVPYDWGLALDLTGK